MQVNSTAKKQFITSRVLLVGFVFLVLGVYLGISALSPDNNNIDRVDQRSDFRADEDVILDFPLPEKKGSGAFISETISNSYIVATSAIAVETEKKAPDPFSTWFKRLLPSRLVYAQKEDVQVIQAEVFDIRGQKMRINPLVQNVSGKMQVRIPGGEESFRPGKYSIRLEVQRDGKRVVTEQEFTRGVLAINTHKSIYTPGETAKIQLAALNEFGYSLCDAPLKVEITDPNGSIQTFTTEDESIVKSGDCHDNNVTDIPDYMFDYQTNASLTGEYAMALTNLDNGYVIEDLFAVAESVKFDVARTAVTRINPFASTYTMEFTIRANEKFSGVISEPIPRGFGISNAVSSLGVKGVTTTGIDGKRNVTWPVEGIKKGDSFTLSYTYQAPEVSPYFYLLGPLEFYPKATLLKKIFRPQGGPVFGEKRRWQIASDANDYLDPDGDGTVAGTLTTCASGSLENTCLDEGTRSPTAPSTSGDYTTLGSGAQSYYEMGTVTASETTSVQVFVYHRENKNNMFTEVSLWDTDESTQYGGSVQDLTQRLSPAWDSVTWNSLTLTQTQLNNLNVRLRCYKNGSGGPSDCTEFAMYAYITYTSSGDPSWNTGVADFEIWESSSLTWDAGTLRCGATLTDTNGDTVACSSGLIKANTQYRVQSVLKNVAGAALNMNGSASGEFVDHKNVKNYWAGLTPTLGTCGFNDIGTDNTGSPTCTVAYNGDDVRITNTASDTNDVIIGATTGTEGFMYLITTSGVASTTSTSYMDTSIDTFTEDSSKITITATSTLLTQKDYRWYENKDAIQPDTVLADENTKPTLTSTSSAIRLRTNITTGDNGLASSTQAFKLQWGYSTTGTWTDVGTGGGNWYNSNYSYCRPITINNSSVATTTTGGFAIVATTTLTTLKATTSGGNVEFLDGRDIVFTNGTDCNDDGGTLLDFYHEDYNNSTGAIVSWIEVDDLNSSSNTTFLIYYGNDTATDVSDEAGVWGALDEVAVWDMSEDPTGGAPQILDGTSNNNDGTAGGTRTGDQVAGQINGSLDFDESESDNVVTVDIAPSNTRTWLFWLNIKTQDGGNQSILDKWAGGSNNREFKIDVNSADVTLDISNDGTTEEKQIATGYNATVGTWEHGAVKFDGGVFDVYKNGSVVGDDGDFSTETTMYNGTVAVAIGSRYDGGGSKYLDGTLDDVRMYNRVLHANDILTIYNNTNDNTSFLTFESEETESSGTWIFKDNSTPADHATTTAVLLSASETNESYTESNPTIANRNPIQVGEEGEWDFALDPVNATSTTTYYFRVVKSDGTALDGYTNYPSITVDTGAASLTFTTDGNVSFGALSPGTYLIASTTLSVETSNASGWNVTLYGDDQSPTNTVMDHDGDASVGITDQLEWIPGAATTSVGNAVVRGSLDSSGEVLAFRVMTASGSVPFRSTTWWGTSDTDGTAKWAGIASSTVQRQIGNSSVSAPTAVLSTVQYYVNVPVTQETGGYTGPLTFTATVNP